MLITTFRYFRSNFFSDSIPSCIGNLTGLEVLFDYNKFLNYIHH